VGFVKWALWNDARETEISGAAVVAVRRGRVSSVSYRRTVRLIYAGWLPQGEVFGWRGAAGLEIGRHTASWGRAAHSYKAGRSTCLSALAAPANSGLEGLSVHDGQ